MIGIRREDKNRWERRSPLVPEHVARLVDRHGTEIRVQPSPIRAMTDADYARAGASVSEDLSPCSVILGVKEIPVEKLLPEKTYLFFSHVIKGQPYNMAMLRKLMELGCTLVDYEKVEDDEGRRLIFFGRHAGLAGMIDTLWALGQRLWSEGISTPLADIRTAHEYDGLEAAKAAIRAAGARIATDGLPEALSPLVVGFAGYGNVSQGAQEILDLLPVHELSPAELGEAANRVERHRLLKVVFKEEHMVVPTEADRVFDLQEYYGHPERYRGVFARHVPHLTALVNCVYWAPQYPRLISRDLLHGLYGAGHEPRLRVIGDISCDVEGGIECTLKSTDPGNPVYVYLPDGDRVVDGVDGHGPVVLAVDNLPCELPVEASQDFSEALQGFVPELARCAWDRPLDDLELPPEIRRAVIVHRGVLTPGFRHLEEHLMSL